MMGVFSDQYRPVKAVAAVVLLAGLAWHYTQLSVNLPFGWRACMQAPLASDGHVLRFPLYTVTTVDGPQRYTISKTLKDVPVDGDTAGLQVGQTISVLAVFRAADHVAVETHREVHHRRGQKKLLGLLGLGWALWMGSRRFRWQHGRVTVRG